MIAIAQEQHEELEQLHDDATGAVEKWLLDNLDFEPICQTTFRSGTRCTEAATHIIRCVYCPFALLVGAKCIAAMDRLRDSAVEYVQCRGCHQSAKNFDLLFVISPIGAPA